MSSEEEAPFARHSWLSSPWVGLEGRMNGIGCLSAPGCPVCWLLERVSGYNERQCCFFRRFRTYYRRGELGLQQRCDFGGCRRRFNGNLFCRLGRRLAISLALRHNCCQMGGRSGYNSTGKETRSGTRGMLKWDVAHFFFLVPCPSRWQKKALSGVQPPKR